MNKNDAIVQKCSIYVYRMFDIGGEIDLSDAKKILQQKGDLAPYQVVKRTRALVLTEKPLILTMPQWQHQINGDLYTVSTVAKLWSFGAISIRVKFTLENKNFADLAIVGEHLERDDGFHKAIVNIGEQIAKELGSSLVEPKIWDDYEEYLIYSIEESTCSAEAFKNHLANDDLTAMIFTEKPMRFAQEIIDGLNENIIQYSVDDLVLIHWNGALIYDLEDAEQVADTIEFALTQLLELRYYDHTLDKQLANLYKQLEQRSHSLVFNPYGSYAEQAAIEYMEISDIVDRVTNSFKVVGDYYFAAVFRKSLEQFRVRDWRQTVDHKLASLAEVSRLFKGEINERRTLLLEITIVMLITIEVMPFIYSLF